ncbi:phage integrase SAM-like domain-containing protein [Alistipes megaguti]|uniref:phage integrase SAM-like domain-containing protein n=1 Tax=Alistipes megaguti TaxID=2364787 RepID=UPI00235379E7|nr:phage integrase SAM-like domain-containing protein [Alistipes megaguti]
MERTTFGLLFYIRRDKTNKKGEAPVFMRLTINGERADASIKRFIEPHAWNSAKGKANEKSRGGKDLNLYLDAISANILRIQRDLELDKKEVSAQIILNRYLGKEQSDRHTLMEVFRAHNEKCRALSGISLAPGTVIRYETSLRLTEAFLRTTYKKEDCYLDEITHQFVEDYDFYLRTVRRCCHNTTTKYLLNFKKIIRIALAKGWMKKDPFAQVHFHFEPVEREFLEKQELKVLLNKEITITRLAQVRDIFCFCCLTGLAFMDVQQLKPEHLVADIHGKIWIRKARQKTKNMCNIPLLDEAQKIIDRYRDHPYCQTHGVLLPVCSNQKMNSYLKELADICGIRKNLSTHCARHTYAVLQLANGTDIYTVSKMLGKAKQTVYTLSRLGEIPSCRQGRKAYFYEDELLAWINNSKIKPAQEIKKNAERAIYWGTRHGRQHNTLS